MTTNTQSQKSCPAVLQVWNPFLRNQGSAEGDVLTVVDKRWFSMSSEEAMAAGIGAFFFVTGRKQGRY